MYQTYETQEMDLSHAMRFCRQFSERIGAEIDRNITVKGLCTVTCFELEQDEVTLCREIENKLIGE